MGEEARMGSGERFGEAGAHHADGVGRAHEDLCRGAQDIPVHLARRHGVMSDVQRIGASPALVSRSFTALNGREPMNGRGPRRAERGEGWFERTIRTPAASNGAAKAWA